MLVHVDQERLVKLHELSGIIAQIPTFFYLVREQFITEPNACLIHLLKRILRSPRNVQPELLKFL